MFGPWQAESLLHISKNGRVQQTTNMLSTELHADTHTQDVNELKKGTGVKAKKMKNNRREKLKT